MDQGGNSDDVSLPGGALSLVDGLEDYTPVIPDPVLENILARSGLSPQDPRVTRLISVAAQKFVADIAYNALQHCKMRGGGKDTKKNSKDKKYTMTTEDLAMALGEQGITVKKPPYYTN
jgi:transcription initiation factor TFIID subunit 10